MSKRRRFSAEFKSEIVLQLLQGAKRPAEICREYNLAEQTVGVYLHDFLDFADAQLHIGDVLTHVYSYKRIHSALGYLTPAEFEATFT